MYLLIFFFLKKRNFLQRFGIFYANNDRMLLFELEG